MFKTVNPVYSANIKFTAEVLKCYVYYSSNTILLRDGSRKLVSGPSCGCVDNYYG